MNICINTPNNKWHWECVFFFSFITKYTVNINALKSCLNRTWSLFIHIFCSFVFGFCVTILLLLIFFPTLVLISFIVLIKLCYAVDVQLGKFTRRFILRGFVFCYILLELRASYKTTIVKANFFLKPTW